MEKYTPKQRVASYFCSGFRHLPPDITTDIQGSSQWNAAWKAALSHWELLVLISIILNFSDSRATWPRSFHLACFPQFRLHFLVSWGSAYSCIARKSFGLNPNRLPRGRLSVVGDEKTLDHQKEDWFIAMKLAVGLPTYANQVYQQIAGRVGANEWVPRKLNNSVR